MIDCQTRRPLHDMYMDDTMNGQQPKPSQRALYPYNCQITLALQSERHAQQIKRVMEVDPELSNRVVKSFTVVEHSPHQLQM